MPTSPKANCERCGDTGWVHGTSQKLPAVNLDGSDVEGHKYGVLRCGCLEATAKARKILTVYGNDYNAEATFEQVAGVFRREAHQFVEKWVGGAGGMLILGDVGTGKSFLASAICNALLQLHCRSMFFATIAPFLRAAREAEFAEKDRVGAFWSQVEAADIVVLDDVGSEKRTDWSESILYGIVAERYSRRAPVIATSNFGLDEIEGRIGRRTLDRLMGFCKGEPMKMTGNSRRWQ